MRWPWVSRARLDAMEWRVDRMAEDYSRAIDDYNRAIEDFNDLGADRKAQDARYDALLDKYHALKLSGATLPEPSVVRPEREIDPVVQAINEASAGRPGQRAQMLRQLAADRRDPLLDDVELIRRIQGGVPAFEDGVP